MEDGKAAAAAAAQMMVMQQKDAILSPSPSNHHPITIHPHRRPLLNPNNNKNNPLPISSSTGHPHRQLAYEDAWRVCHPDVNRPFSSLQDACERLLPYHVVADYEAEEDDKIILVNPVTTGGGYHVLSRSEWDHNIAAKVADFTATFDKQVRAFNTISRPWGVEKQALLELLMDSRQMASRRANRS